MFTRTALKSIPKSYFQNNLKNTATFQSFNKRSYSKVPITLIEGDGIGPEITKATVDILKAADAQLALEKIVVGEKMYLSGHASGISPDSWEVIRRNKIMLKAPITTPIGKGYKSLNVTMRKTLGLYANVRPCISYAPFIKTNHPDMNVLIVRENEEDLYAGIEHRQTQEVVQCLKLISRPGSERIIRFAYEYAKLLKRDKITVFVKDNIMKLTDGLFAKLFEDIGAKDYPEMNRERAIIDIAAAQLADTPENFDVIVTENLYGDIVSDIAAQITGSVGLGGSANIGKTAAMFEAIHGSAPPIAGMNVANPSGMILASVMMLQYVDHHETAEKIHNAWMSTIEDGIHTQDIFKSDSEHSKEKVSTTDFAKAVIERLGKKPSVLTPVNYSASSGKSMKDWTPQLSEYKEENKELVGFDMFLDHKDRNPNTLAEKLQKLISDMDDMELKIISNRGTKVWPDYFEETMCVDHWRCRFRLKDVSKPLNKDVLLKVLQRANEQGLDFIKFENLYYFDGKPGYTLGQGE